MNKKVNAILQCSKTIIPNVTGICLNYKNNSCYIVSDNEYYNNKLIVSTDGINWETITLYNINNEILYKWKAICWSPELESNNLCAIGDNGYFIRSSNGINWALSIIGDGSANYEIIYWSETDHQYCAISTEHLKKATSLDGVNWDITDLSINELNNIQKNHFTSAWNVNTALTDIVIDKININGSGNITDNNEWFDTTDGPFAVVIDETNNDYIVISYDNITKKINIAYPKDDNKNLNININEFTTNIDYNITFNSSDILLTCADYSDTLKYSCGISKTGNKCYSMVGYDINEFSSVNVLNQPITDIKWINSLGAFYVLTSGGQNASSATGLSWSKGLNIANTVDNGLEPTWNKLCWSAEHELLIAISSSNFKHIAVSNDGRNWELREIYNDTEFCIADIKWIKNLNQFVMIDNISNTVLTSYDAINWTSHTINEAFDGFKSISWSNANNELYLVSNNRTLIHKTTDLLTWELVKLPETDNWIKAEWINYKAFLILFGYDKLLYTSDLINWQIIDHEYNVTYPMNIIEVSSISKCTLINSLSGQIYTLNLKPGSDMGFVLNDKQKWLIANYPITDNINLVNNSDFSNNEFDNWNIIGEETEDVNGIRKYLLFDTDLNTNFAKIINRYTTDANGLGIESDWINVNNNTTYNCHLLAKADGTCYAYLYGQTADLTVELIKISDHMLNLSVFTDIDLSFISLNYNKIKIAIKFSNPNFDDFFMFSNVFVIPYATIIKDFSQFDNNANINNCGIEFNSILSDNCIKTKGIENSYIEFAQPFAVNDRISLAMWIKFNNLDFNGQKAVIYSGTESSNLKLCINKKSNKNTLFIELMQNEIDTDFNIIENKWYHIAYTYDLSLSNLYVDGILVNSYKYEIPDYTDIIYKDSSYFSRIGNLAKSNDSNYIISTWDGNSITTNWYLNNNSNNYVINSASDLAGLALLVNSGADNFANCIISLKTNIDLNNHEWTPIGFYDRNNDIYRPFKGIFNGNNLAIENVYINRNSNHILSHSYGFDTNNALFGFVDGTETDTIATITSITVNGTITSLINPITYSDEILADDFNTAGIIAKGINCKISNCIYNGTILSLCTIGSIVGDGDNVELYDCINNATLISNLSLIGGIAGYLNSSKIVNCINNGNITLTTNITNTAIGGITGYFFGGNLENEKYYEISNCINNGIILGKSEDYSIINISIGGIVGQIDNLSAETRVQGCHNIGNITSISNAGGIIGTVLFNEKNIKVFGCLNTGNISGILELTGIITDITGKRNLGGIIGNIEYYCIDWLNLYGCINTGNIYKGENSGGILGINKNKTNIFNCFNNGIIENNYNSSGIVCNINGFIKINNCVNVGNINIFTAQFPTYIGCIVGVTENIGFIYADDNNLVLSRYNIYEEKTLSTLVNIFDSNVNALSKTKNELEQIDILNNYLNLGINDNATYKYTLYYDDGVITFNDILEFLNISNIYPIPEETISTIINKINNNSQNVSEYTSLALSICDLKFYDYIISQKNIRELSHAKLLQYKCIHKSETNTNFIPVNYGTYDNLTAKNDGDVLPVIELIEDPINIFGGKVWKIEFLANSITSDLGYHSRVETDIFELPSSEANSNFTFSIYIKGNSDDINKLSFKFIVNNTEIPVFIEPSDEIIGSEALGGIYTRYTITTNTIAEQNAEIYQIIGLKAGVLGTLDENILEEPFTIYLAAPQLENKDHATDFISAPVIGKLYDSSTHMKHITFDLDDCPTYNEEEHAYSFTPYKKIIIPKTYVKETNSFTISFWFKAVTLDGYVPSRFIIGKTASFFAPGAGWHISVDKVYNDIIFEAANSNEVKDVRFYTGCNFTDWKHLIAVYDNGKMYTYVNGINISINESSFNMTPFINDIIIGSNFISSDDITINHMFGDMISDIRIYNTALSSIDALDLYRGSGIVDTTGVLHAYNFTAMDEDNQVFTINKNNLISTDWYNNTNIETSLVEYWPLSGISKNYTPNDNPLYVNAIKAGKGIKNSKCVVFNGGNSFAYSKGQLDIDNLGSLTISFWIKIERNYKTKSCIMEYSEDALNNNAFSIYYNEDGTIQFNDYNINDNFTASLKSNTTINDNLWHYITIVILRGKNLYIFIDCNKDAIANNYAEDSAINSTYGIPKTSWINEIDYNNGIANLQFADNKIFINNTNNINEIKRYSITGDINNTSILSNLVNMENSLIQKIIIDDINNIIYCILYNFDIGNSYVMSYNMYNGIKKIITDCYYSSVLLLNNNKLYVSDKNIIKKTNQEFNRFKITTDNVGNYINISDCSSLVIEEITEIYTGTLNGDIFTKTKIFDSSLYELYNNQILWISTEAGNYPEEDYYIDFKYNCIGYSNYNIKCIDLISNNITFFNTNHTDIITGIDVDNLNNVYTSSYDGTVKKTSLDNLIWKFDLFNNWVNNVKVSSDNQYIYASSRDKTVRKIDKYGNQIWCYTDPNNCEIIDFVLTYNNYLYLAGNNNAEDIRNLISTDKIWTSSYNCITKLDDKCSVLWTKQIPSPVNNIYLIPNSNNIIMTSNAGTIECINEVFSTPYENHKLYVGSHNNTSDFLKAYIQDIKIYNRELTLTEMINQYNSFSPTLNKIAYITNNNTVFLYQDIDEIN